MKGLEGLPLKFIIMLIVVVLIAAATIHIANVLGSMSFDATIDANRTLSGAFNRSLEGILSNESAVAP